MVRQTKFFEKEFVANILNDFKQIKSKEISFQIYNSDRSYSKSMYIGFWHQIKDIGWRKLATLRISDHTDKNCIHPQFIVDLSGILTKKKVALFRRTISNCIKKCKHKVLQLNINKISRMFDNSNNKVV